MPRLALVRTPGGRARSQRGEQAGTHSHRDTLPRVPLKYLYRDELPLLVRHTGPTTRPGVAPDTSRGEALVLIHGAGSNRIIFEPLLERLEATHSPIAFDLPGHGRSGDLDSLSSIVAMADLTRALVEQLGIARPVLVGFDMGSAIALEYALADPAAVRALVLVSAPAGEGVSAPLLERYRRVTEGKEGRPFRPELFAPGTPPELMRSWFMGELQTDPRATYGDLQALDAWRPSEQLAALATPVCAISGAENADASGSAEALAGALSNAELISIEKAGHLIPVEQPDALAVAITSFLEGLEK
ncbi:MAG: alpha/beta hydrolase [Myxococcota bacterium]|nr:alpha/beta hydrolase [Myxococcota bacterium]